MNFELEPYKTIWFGPLVLYSYQGQLQAICRLIFVLKHSGKKNKWMNNSVCSNADRLIREALTEPLAAWETPQLTTTQMGPKTMPVLQMVHIWISDNIQKVKVTHACLHQPTQQWHSAACYQKKKTYSCVFVAQHLSLSGVSWGEEGAASRSFSYLMSRGAMFDFAKGS